SATAVSDWFSWFSFSAITSSIDNRLRSNKAAMGAYPTIARWGIVAAPNSDGKRQVGCGLPHHSAEADMAEDKPGLHVDTDWKKQAQEEKRKLAEQEEKRKAAATAPAGVVPGAAGAVGAASAAAPATGPAAIGRQAG